MAILLSLIAGSGAAVVLGFLIRNLFLRGRHIRTSPYPAFTRTSCNMSIAVCLFCIAPWTAAAFESSDFDVWLAFMGSPLLLTLLLALGTKKLMERQPPEVRSYAEELSRSNPRMRRFQERIDQQRGPR